MGSEEDVEEIIGVIGLMNGQPLMDGGTGNAVD
jgi:hypothetical protein